MRKEHTSKYTQEMVDYIRQIAKGKTKMEIVELFNDKFNAEITVYCLMYIMKRWKIKSGLDGRFKKGLIPHNKGVKMSKEKYEKCKGTMFKKGNIPHNYRPIGSERITKDGFVEIKVADPSVWVSKQRFVYEKHYGKIPKGYLCIFLDGNRRNFDIENLAIVSLRENAVINKNKLCFKNAELRKIGINIVKAKNKIADVKKRSE